MYVVAYCCTSNSIIWNNWSDLVQLVSSLTMNLFIFCFYLMGRYVDLNYICFFFYVGLIKMVFKGTYKKKITFNFVSAGCIIYPTDINELFWIK